MAAAVAMLPDGLGGKEIEQMAKDRQPRTGGAKGSGRQDPVTES